MQRIGLYAGPAWQERLLANPLSGNFGGLYCLIPLSVVLAQTLVGLPTIPGRFRVAIAARGLRLRRRFFYCIPWISNNNSGGSWASALWAAFPNPAFSASESAA